MSVAPFSAKSTSWIAGSTVQLHYLDEGKGDSPILAVHGNPTWSFYWRKLVSRFSKKERVLAIDHVGCGLSDKPEDYPYTLERRRDDLLSLLHHLDLRRITLVVHDWGGPIGLSALVAEPERFSRIVLLNTAAFPPPYVPFRIAICRIPLLGTLAMRGANLFSRAAVYMTMHRQKLSSIARSGLLWPYDSWQHRVAIARFVEDIPRQPSHPTWQLLERLEQQLTEVKLPVKLIWGMKDWCFRPDCLDRLLKIFPHGEALPIADAGHYVMEDATDDVLGAIEQFIKG
jgi:haloalkane dehalogenase